MTMQNVGAQSHREMVSKVQELAAGPQKDRALATDAKKMNKDLISSRNSGKISEGGSVESQSHSRTGRAQPGRYNVGYLGNYESKLKKPTAMNELTYPNRTKKRFNEASEQS